MTVLLVRDILWFLNEIHMMSFDEKSNFPKEHLGCTSIQFLLLNRDEWSGQIHVTVSNNADSHFEMMMTH